VALPSVGITEDAGILVIEPPRHLLLIGLTRLAFGLLAGPIQALLEDLADMLGVEGLPEMPLNEAGNASGGPQFVGPAMSLGSLQEQGFELRQMVVSESRPWAQLPFGVDAMGLLGFVKPTSKCFVGNAKDASDGRAVFTLSDKVNGPSSSAFEFSRGSNWSTHSTYTQLHCLRFVFNAGTSNRGQKR
jgi:hypothetical protein